MWWNGNSKRWPGRTPRPGLPWRVASPRFRCRPRASAKYRAGQAAGAVQDFALRLGADRVTVLYRRTVHEMPAQREELDAVLEGTSDGILVLSDSADGGVERDDVQRRLLPRRDARGAWPADAARVDRGRPSRVRNELPRPAAGRTPRAAQRL